MSHVQFRADPTFTLLIGAFFVWVQNYVVVDRDVVSE